MVWNVPSSNSNCASCSKLLEPDGHAEAAEPGDLVVLTGVAVADSSSSSNTDLNLDFLAAGVSLTNSCSLGIVTHELEDAEELEDEEEDVAASSCSA